MLYYLDGLFRTFFKILSSLLVVAVCMIALDMTDELSKAAQIFWEFKYLFIIAYIIIYSSLNSQREPPPVESYESSIKTRELTQEELDQKYDRDKYVRGPFDSYEERRRQGDVPGPDSFAHDLSDERLPNSSDLSDSYGPTYDDCSDSYDAGPCGGD